MLPASLVVSVIIDFFDPNFWFANFREVLPQKIASDFGVFFWCHVFDVFVFEILEHPLQLSRGTNEEVVCRGIIVSGRWQHHLVE